LFSIGAPHTGHFAAIIDSSPCLKIDKSSRWDNKCKIVYLSVKGAKAYTKLLYHGSTKFSILFWRKAPQISEQKTGHVFFTERYTFL